jgi:PhnB protein
MPVKPIPDGYHTATPYLIVHDAVRALEFYTRALGAKELMRFADPSGKIAHSEFRLGDSVIMLADEFAEMGFRSARSLGGTPVSLLLYVEDVDARFARALAAGATQMRPVENQFYGDRTGTLVDPFGHVWTLATHVEDVSPEELERRAQTAMKEGHSE